MRSIRGCMPHPTFYAVVIVVGKAVVRSSALSVLKTVTPIIMLRALCVWKKIVLEISI